MLTKSELESAGITRERLASYLCRVAAMISYESSSELDWYETLWEGVSGYQDAPWEDLLPEIDEDMSVDDLLKDIINEEN